MASKKDVQRLLKKGLTGWEAGILAFESFWRESRNQEPILSDRDLSTLKAGIRTQKDIEDYNRLIQLYRTAEYIERQAYTALLGATAELERAAGLGYLRLAPIMAEARLQRLPTIVTEKQYQDIMARQRESKLQGIHSLWDIFDSRASEMFPDKADPGEVDILLDEHPELYQQAVQSVLQYIRQGKLRPVQIDEQAIQGLKALSREEEEQRVREKEHPEEPVSAWAELSRKEEELLQASYRAARSQLTKEGQDNLVRLLEWYVQTQDLPAGEAMSEEEQERLINYTYCSGEELYQAGLPEQVRWLDEFTPGLDEDTATVAYAILQEPWDFLLDERGYYKEERLEHWPFAPMIGEEEWTGLHSEVTAIATGQIGEMLARRQALEETSHYIGLALYEVLDVGIEGFLKPAIGRYNTLAEIASAIDSGPGKLSEQFGHLLIQWKKLRPPRKELATVREWIAESLGEDWWKGVQDRHREPRPIMQIPDFAGLKEAEDES